MRAPLRAITALVVVALACLSTVHFAVTDSWYSDVESVEIGIETGGSDVIISSSFVIYGGNGPGEDGSYTLLKGNHSIVLLGLEVSFTIKQGTLKVGETEYSSEIVFSVPDDPVDYRTILFEVITESVVLIPKN